MSAWNTCSPTSGRLARLCRKHLHRLCFGRSTYRRNSAGNQGYLLQRTGGSLTMEDQTSRVIKFKFPLQPQEKYYITQHGERGFTAYSDERWYHCLPILTTPLIEFSLRGWENVLFGLASKRVTLSFPRVIKFKFPLQSHQKCYIT